MPKTTSTYPCHQFYGLITFHKNPPPSTPAPTFDFSYSCSTKETFLTSTAPFYESSSHLVFLFGKILSIDTDIFELTDTNQEQLVEKLFLHYGKDFQKLIDGQFLIIIFDKINNTWIFLNNRYQATTLYYYHCKDYFIFASTMSMLLTILPSKPEFDKESLPEFISSGFCKSEHMQFKNVCRLFPTCRIIIGENFNIEHHWSKDLSFNRKPFDNLETHLNKYESVIKKGMLNYINFFNTKRLGCYLSGGQDTSFIYLLASQIYNKPIHTFTVSIKGSMYDEAPKAEAVNKLFGGIHHRIIMTTRDLDHIPAMISSCEEPTAGSSLPMYLCALEAKKHNIDTIFSGDGGDPLWGEYYPVAAWQKILERIPPKHRLSLHQLAILLKRFLNWERFMEFEFTLSLFKSRNYFDGFFKELSRYRHYDDHFLKKILKSSEFPVIKLKDCMVRIPFTSTNFFNALIEAKLLYGTPTYMISCTQKPLEKHGIRFYPPFLNKEVMDFICSLPLNWIYKGNSFNQLTNTGIQRRFHKTALLRHIPREIVFAKKQYFNMPFHALFVGREAVLDVLLKALKKRPWFNCAELEKMFYEFPRQRIKSHETCELKHHGYRIFSLLTFEVWYREFVEKKVKNILSDPPIPLEEYLSQ